MELRQALDQIAEIRQQMARGQIFRGYRAATTAFSGVAAVVTAALQLLLVPRPIEHPLLFVGLWVAAATLCLLVVAGEMIVRTRRSQSQVQRQLTLLAVEQFLPSVAAGALLTWVVCDFLRSELWMLPGLWMMLFSLGIFASSRLLPRAVFGVGAFYLLAGVVTLIAAARLPDYALNLLMGGIFAAGQGAIAAILYLRLERDHD